MERFQRREVFRPELEQPLRGAQVLQPMQAEVAHIDAGKVHGRLRQQHLPAVSGGRDPRRPVHVEPDVALIDSKRLARVQTHPHPHRAARERELRVGRGGHRIGRTREGDEERVALRVDLDALVQLPGIAQRAVVLCEHDGVPVAEFLQQPSRALDVREEERDRPGRELGPHAAILSRLRPGDQRTLALAIDARRDTSAEVPERRVG